MGSLKNINKKPRLFKVGRFRSTDMFEGLTYIKATEEVNSETGTGRS